MFAWTGAALFAISLVYFGYNYLIHFATPAASTPHGAIPWNVALFSLFALHHSLFARTALRTLVTRYVAAERERPFYVWVASLLFIAACALWQPVAGVAWSVEGPARIGLALLQLLGVWLTLRGAAIVGVWQLAGVKPATPPAEFRTDGPYGWVRHPIYTGWFLLVFPVATMTGTRLLFAVISSLYLLLAIPLEEASLRRSTGDAYRRYERQVRWKLVPGVY